MKNKNKNKNNTGWKEDFPNPGEPYKDRESISHGKQSA